MAHDVTQGYFSLLRWRNDVTRDEARNVAVLLAEVRQLKQLGEAENRVQRRPQLMTGTGQEGVLSLGSADGLIAGSSKVSGPAVEKPPGPAKGAR